MSDPDLIHTVRLSEATFAPPAEGGGRRALLVTGLGALVLSVLGVLNNGLWILAGVSAVVFLCLLLVAASRRSAARQIASGTVDDLLLVFEARYSGLTLQYGVTLPWEAIDSVEFLWKGPSGGSSLGMSTGQKIGQQLAHRALSSQGVDGSKRLLRVIPRDYAALKAATPKAKRGWFSGPLLGQPGWVTVDLSRFVDDDGFRAVLGALDDRLRAHGRELRRVES